MSSNFWNTMAYTKSKKAPQASCWVSSREQTLVSTSNTTSRSSLKESFWILWCEWVTATFVQTCCKCPSGSVVSKASTAAWNTFMMRAAWARVPAFPCSFGRVNLIPVWNCPRAVWEYKPSVTTEERSGMPRTFVCCADTSPGNGWKWPRQSRWDFSWGSPKSPWGFLSEPRKFPPFFWFWLALQPKTEEWEWQVATCSLS